MKAIKQTVLYRVSATAQSKEAGERFYSWMLNEHGDDLLEVPGCIECRVFRKSETEFETHYLFETMQSLQNYYEKHASRLRQKGKDLFAAGEVQLHRDELVLVAEGTKIGG